VSLHDERTDGGSSPPGQNPPNALVLPVHRSQPGFRNFQTWKTRRKKNTKLRETRNLGKRITLSSKPGILLISDMDSNRDFISVAKI
jgi:hypothetical protein